MALVWLFRFPLLHYIEIPPLLFEQMRHCYSCTTERRISAFPLLCRLFMGYVGMNMYY